MVAGAGVAAERRRPEPGSPPRRVRASRPEPAWRPRRAPRWRRGRARGRRRGAAGGRSGARGRGALEEDDELEGGDVGLAAVARGVGRGAVAAGAAGRGLLVGLRQRDAGHAVDRPQAGHQGGDLRLRVGAARQRDRRRGDRAADPAAGGAAAEVALEGGDRDVGRDGAGEVAQRLLPVEAGVGQIGDGLDAGVGDRLEVRVGLERRDLLRDGRRLGGRRGQLGLAVLHGVAGQHIGGQRAHGEGEDTEHDERTGAGVLDSGGDRGSGSLGAAAQVGRKQVDSSHLAWLIGTPLDRLEASRVG